MWMHAFYFFTYNLTGTKNLVNSVDLVTEAISLWLAFRLTIVWKVTLELLSLSIFRIAMGDQSLWMILRKDKLCYGRGGVISNIIGIKFWSYMAFKTFCQPEFGSQEKFDEHFSFCYFEALILSISWRTMLFHFNILIVSLCWFQRVHLQL